MPLADRNLDKETPANENIDKLTNIDAEIAIIGCLLWDNRSYEKIADFLNEEHFSDKKIKKFLALLKNY